MVHLLAMHNSHFITQLPVRLNLLIAYDQNSWHSEVNAITLYNTK